jgi:peptidoglycan/xylan/chitin deacetylase (PgdA/CDA1 family)
MLTSLALLVLGQNPPEIRRGLKQTVVVLTYHDIIKKRTKSSLWFDCSAKELDDQLTAMDRAGVNYISVDQLYAYLTNGKPLPRHPVCITFADDYLGYFTYGLPILHKHLAASAQFVHTAFVGSKVGRPKLTWTGLVGIQRDYPVTIGSQTVTHPADLRTLSDTQLDQEMGHSRYVVQTELGHIIRYLAYPNGKFDRRVEAAARRAGYWMAFTEVCRPANDSPSIFAVNRYVHTRWREALNALLKGK